MTLPARPPETLEGWYALHQVFTFIDQDVRARAREHHSALAAALDTGGADGWSVLVTLIGSTADVMLIHVRPTLDAIGEVQCRVADSEWTRALRLDSSFLSVTEAGLYHLSAQLGGDPDELARRVAAERENPHVKRRLYPPVPDGMPYVCFYPMSKRRNPAQNWYALALEERSRLMRTHGETGRRYAGKVVQIITGAIGLDAWEWGVTLFAKDPLDFKKLVTDMRFDEVSACYAEFGPFHVGRLTPLV